MFKKCVLLILITWTAMNVGCADDKVTVNEVTVNEATVNEATANEATANKPGKATVKKAIAKIFPNQKIDIVEMTPIKDVYEVVIGTEVFYVSKDGKYVFSGDLIELSNRRSLTERRRAGIRKEILKAQTETGMIVFPAKKAKFKVTIFTDIDCGYCRKLHQQMAGYNEKGITVRYMAFPRAGLRSRSYQKAVNVWCAKDPKKAMTDAKAGINVESPSCSNPVKSHYELGNKLGVRGTPAIFLDSGNMLPGYMPPAQLLAELANN